MSSLIKYCLNSKNIKRCYSSSLYVTGDKAQNNFVALVPHIDFEELLQNRAALIANIKARQLNLDLSKLEKRWNFYKMIDDQKTILEATRAEISSILSKLKEENADKNRDDIDKLTLHRNLVRRDLQNIKDFSYGVEENAMLGVLGLPNKLHEKTPVNSIADVIYTFGEKPSNSTDSHIELGHQNQLIKYVNPLLYFVKNDAALYELALSNYFQTQMRHFNFQQFSNADFARSIIVEGCTNCYLNPDKVFTLDDPHNEKRHEISKLHLVGGASLCSFMAYFAKHLLQSSVLPLKLFAWGRNYQPTPPNLPESLLNVSQETVLRVFIACTDEQKQIDEQIKLLIDKISDIYQSIGFHFRLVYLPAHQLDLAESLRLSIQMYSNHLNNYVEIGNVSHYDNYLSKRLLFNYTEHKERKFTQVLSGNILNVPKLLACLIENSNGHLCINNHSILKQYL